MIRSTVLRLVLVSLAMPVCAEEALKGQVQLAGSIVDSACSINVGSTSQTISFKPLALSGLLSGDRSSVQPLTIFISDCIKPEHSRSASSSQGFQLIFEGQPHGKYFGIGGGARGVALQITDSQGKLISPGMVLVPSARANDGLLLNFSLMLVGSGQALEAGDYHATIKLSIQHF